MVMLTVEQQQELGPLVGEVVLRFADLEGATIRLATMAYRDPRGQRALAKNPFSEQLGHLTGQLNRLGEQEAAAVLCRELAALKQLSELRNRVVHGEWFWNHGQAEVQTRKTDQGGGGEEFVILKYLVF